MPSPAEQPQAKPDLAPPPDRLQDALAPYPGRAIGALNRVLLTVTTILASGFLGLLAYVGVHKAGRALLAGALLGTAAGLAGAWLWVRLIERWVARMRAAGLRSPGLAALAARQAGRKYGVLLGLAAATAVHLGLWAIVGPPEGRAADVWPAPDAFWYLLRGAACGVLLGAFLGGNFGYSLRECIIQPASRPGDA